MIYFDGWAGLVRVVLVGVPAYLALVLLLRIAGNRTLAKLNAFDFIVTVALGSTLATVLLSSTVALAEGITAFTLLVALQFVVAWASARSPAVRRLVRSEPTLLYRDGFLAGAMRTARVTGPELRQAARSHGHSELTSVGAIVLETDGTLSILDATPTRFR